MPAFENELECLGIDLGTTNSCVSVVKDGAAQVVKIDGEPTTPSVLACRKGEWMIGHPARNHGQVAPEEAVASIKRHMDDLDYRVRLGGFDLTPVDVSAKILENLVSGAEKSLERKINKAVITVPAWFREGQRQATLAAGKRAGLEVLQIINEPTAAAIAHETDQVKDGDEENWLVYDLGGGTFDVSVLSISGRTREVLSSVGNTFLGGDDFDRRLVERFSTRIKDRHDLDPDEYPIARARLSHIAETTKIRLSTETQVEVKEPVILGDKSVLLEDVLLRGEFEDLIRDLVDSTLEKVDEALSEAGLEAAKIDRLLLVGGSTRIPTIAEALKTRYGLDGESWVDPDLSVAMGAAIQAAITTGMFFEREVVEISPHSLGVAALGEEDTRQRSEFMEQGHPLTFAPIVRRNSRLPATAIKSFYKMSEQQREVNIMVYQGESTNVQQNTFVGEFRASLENRSDRRLDVRFSYDLNGIIQISILEAGRETIESHTMDLSQSVSENSRNWEDKVFLDGEDVDRAETENVSAAEPNQRELTNFLIEKLSKILAESPNPEIADKLAQYRNHLQAGNDDAIDNLEAELYDWLEQDYEDAIEPQQP